MTRIALICCFSNQDVRNKTEFTNLKYENTFRRLVGLPKFVSNSVAPWVTSTINGLKANSNVELHVISLMPRMKFKTQEFAIDNVKYYLVRDEKVFPWNYIERKLNPKQYCEFPRNRKYIKNFVEKIQPDIILLSGAENPQYSSSCLDINGIPILLLMQTVFSNPSRLPFITGKDGKIDKHSQNTWDKEQALFEKIDYYACRSRLYYDLVKQYNPNAYIFPFIWPEDDFPFIPEVKKKYDFAYWGGISAKKGIENALNALSIVKQNDEDISLLVVGKATTEYMKIIQDLVDNLNIRNNVTFVDYFPNKNDMLKCVKQARYALLPIKLDVISGTIIDAMNLKMPIVTNITTGTPSLNNEAETVLLSEIDDDESLANNMHKLMNDPDLAIKLTANAEKYLEKRHSLVKNSTEKLVCQIQTILNHYRKHISIPDDILYDNNL